MIRIINNLLNKDLTNLSFKERQLITDYFRLQVNQEFSHFKEIFLKKDKEEIFNSAYVIDSYDNIRILLNDLSFFNIVKLLKNVKENYIDYMYELEVNKGVFDYYDDIEKNIEKNIPNIPINKKTNVA